jgi:hypothetical protein
MEPLIWESGDTPGGHAEFRKRGSPTVSLTIVAKFHSSILICGHIRSGGVDDIQLKDIKAAAKDLVGISWRPDDGASPGISPFRAQLLLSQSAFPEDLALSFHFARIAPIRIRIQDILQSAEPPRSKLRERFEKYLQRPTTQKVLDIGGRARSGLLHANEMKDKDVTVLDIVADEGVTVVADAHELSSVLPASYFDAVTSFAVFEHLIMPWKVAIEMNRVMKVGAWGFIYTHQTIGMHDLPCDYFRFSDNAWKGIFNKDTGFEIIGTELSDPQYIVSFVWSEAYKDAEKTAGYATSLVCVRKIAQTAFDWPLRAADVTEDQYPVD